MKSVKITCIVAMTLLVSLTIPGSLAASEITTFEAPGAGVTAGQGTIAEGINLDGAVTGFYIDTNNALHAYLRAPNGAFTAINARVF
jgi:hypothetical protein